MRKFAIVAAVALAGCTTASGPTAPPRGPGPVAVNPAGGTCNAAAGQSFVGQIATVEVGQSILAATNAKILRWEWPGMMMTMEYSPERVGVRYGPDLRIIAVSCG